MGKVCDLSRGLETDISVVLTVMSGLGILFDRDTTGSRFSGSIHGFGLMMIMMFLDEEMIHGLVIAKTWLPLIINT